MKSNVEETQWHMVFVDPWWYVHKKSEHGDVWDEAGRFASKGLAQKAVDKLNSPVKYLSNNCLVCGEPMIGVHYHEMDEDE